MENWTIVISASSAVRSFTIPCNFRVGIGEYSSKVFESFKNVKIVKNGVCVFFFFFWYRTDVAVNA